MNCNHQKKVPTPDERERAERLREVIDALCEINNHVPVIVEGKKDAQALRKLGLAGQIFVLHGGKGIYEFSEDIAEKCPDVVILLDWDAKGDALFKSLSCNLRTHWEEFAEFRELFKMLCQKDIKDIESIPSLLMRLEGCR